MLGLAPNRKLLLGDGIKTRAALKEANYGVR
jgi:hypothetical protein